jgi:hypothetical protein
LCKGEIAKDLELSPATLTSVFLDQILYECFIVWLKREQASMVPVIKTASVSTGLVDCHLREGETFH